MAIYGMNYPMLALELIGGEPEWKVNKILALQKYGHK
jgi:hypothetical protein